MREMVIVFVVQFRRGAGGRVVERGLFIITTLVFLVIIEFATQSAVFLTAITAFLRLV